jgi:hypothetical protein
VSLSSKRLLRLVFLGVIVVSAVALGASYVSSGLGATTEELAADR